MSKQTGSCPPIMDSNGKGWNVHFVPKIGGYEAYSVVYNQTAIAKTLPVLKDEIELIANDMRVTHSDLFSKREPADTFTAKEWQDLFNING